MIKLLLPISIFLLICSSCSVVYRTVLGIDSSPKWLLENEISKKFDNRKIPGANRFVLDTASYYRALKADFSAELEKAKASNEAMDSLYFKKMAGIVKDDSQAVQVRYFDKEGKAIFKLVNCYIDPPIPMNWNVEGSFEVFPPHNKIETLNFRNRELSYFLPHIKKLNGKEIGANELPNADYYAIVLWNDVMIKPSKKLIKQLKKYDNKHLDQNTYFLFVNNHNAYLWPHMDAKQKNEVKEYIEQNRLNLNK